MLNAAGGAGQLILKVYKATGVLSDSNRASLAKIIINNETAGDFGRRYIDKVVLFPLVFSACLSLTTVVLAHVKLTFLFSSVDE